jgi:hypothetical protein
MIKVFFYITIIYLIDIGINIGSLVEQQVASKHNSVSRGRQPERVNPVVNPQVSVPRHNEGIII